jgi:thiamine-monophosphate kinase
MSNAPREGGILHGEQAIIDILAPLSHGYPGAFGLRDDCALITPEPGTELVVKTDPVAEGVHFLADDTPEDIAWKALAVNVSDLAAKGARPIAYLLALSFPQPPQAIWMTRFAAGLAAAQKTFGCHLVGGDTDQRPGPLTIGVTVIGSVSKGGMVQRGTAQSGDVLFVSGTIGDATLGLALRKSEALAASWGLRPADVAYLVGRYTRPAPRLELGVALRAYASAAMDISDGLLKDAGRLCRASAAAAQVRMASIPMSPAASRMLEAAPERLMQIIIGGDDYELLASVPPQYAGPFSAAAASFGVPVTRIGELREGPPAVELVAADGRTLELPRSTGWDHF